MIMPIKSKILLMEGLTTTSGNDTDTYGRVIKNYGHQGLMLWVPRTAESGTCTSNTYLQALKPMGDETDATHWFDCAAILTAAFADGETGTYMGLLHPRVATAAISTTAGLKVNHTVGYLPETFRLRFRSGGTGVTNTYGDVWGVLLP